MKNEKSCSTHSETTVKEMSKRTLLLWLKISSKKGGKSCLILLYQVFSIYLVRLNSAVEVFFSQMVCISFLIRLFPYANARKCSRLAMSNISSRNEIRYDNVCLKWQITSESSNPNRKLFGRGGPQLLAPSSSMSQQSAYIVKTKSERDLLHY